MLKNRPTTLNEWLNTALMVVAILSVIFVAGHKDQQLEDLTKISSQLVIVSSEQGKNLAELKINYSNIKERVDALYLKR